ncbi:diaminopimelate decarboxylase [Thioalkalivibrio sp. HK1]|uniref:diaminopimelate decarboxylase n=1 Tax=Thioalkalivibrio sp. HK1 TaxID=1469245 RepID=UPI0005713D3F|nr:diaminopimelate decarboxylase [Thioalkalivibrio sp. HK1]
MSGIGDAGRIEGVDLEAIAAHVGTPVFVYSRLAIESAWLEYDRALDGMAHRICYAVKANSNLAVLDILARLGAGFDIVSGGELARVLAVGAEPSRIVFSGVGKLDHEIRSALEAGIGCFNVESEPELDKIAAIAESWGASASISLRVNPDVDPGTHPYIATGLGESKFGIPIAEAPAIYAKAAATPSLSVHGVDCHIGSQLSSIEPFLDALDRVLALIDTLARDGIVIRHLNLGGGLGIRYRDETPPEPSALAGAIVERIQGRDLTLVLEPGRSITGNAGLLLTRVHYIKRNGDKRFAIVDAAMNDLIRPALYGAWQEIVAVSPRNRPGEVYDIVGPVCESGDFLGHERELALDPGDLLAVHSAGAYGFVMSSNYNTRPRAAEVMVDGDRFHIVRRREPVDALFADESLLPPGEGAARTS